MIFFFLNRNYFNSLEHCQSKQTVSYNVEWCLQLQYVECSGDTWYCDTELLFQISKLHLQNILDYWGDSSHQLCLTAQMHRGKNWDLANFKFVWSNSFSSKFLNNNKQIWPLKENRGFKRKPGTDFFFFFFGENNRFRGIFCKQGWYSVVRHFQLTSIKGYFRFYIQMIVNLAKNTWNHIYAHTFSIVLRSSSTWTVSKTTMTIHT